MDDSKQVIMLLRHIKIVLLKIADQMDIELQDAELSIPAPVPILEVEPETSDTGAGVLG